MEPSDPLDPRWISIHIRDHLEDRAINIRDSLITPYPSPLLHPSPYHTPLL